MVIVGSLDAQFVSRISYFTLMLISSVEMDLHLTIPCEHWKIYLQGFERKEKVFVLLMYPSRHLPTINMKMRSENSTSWFKNTQRARRMMIFLLSLLQIWMLRSFASQRLDALMDCITTPRWECRDEGERFANRNERDTRSWLKTQWSACIRLWHRLNGECGKKSYQKLITTLHCTINGREVRWTSICRMYLWNK